MMAGQQPTDATIAPARPLENVERCPLCDSERVQAAPLQPAPPFGLQQCGGCGFIFLSPRPTADSMKSYYDDFYGQCSAQPDPRQAARARRHVRRLQRYHPRPGRLLEVGSGDGYLLNAAREAGWQVEGLEISPARLANARDWFGLQLGMMDLMAAPYPPGSFDAVVMFQLIEHVHHPRAIFQRAHDLLRTGGVLMLSTPNVLAHARKQRGLDSWCIPRHLSFFTPKTMVQLVQGHGFEVIRRPLKFLAAFEGRLNWQPWPSSHLLSRLTRNLWTPFGIQLAARKK